MRFVPPLSDDEVTALKSLHNHADKPATRRRAHAILLSHKQFSMDQIAHILDITRETVGILITNWENNGLDSLEGKPHPGRPPIYSESEIDDFVDLLQKSPHQLKTAQAKLEQETGKHSCAMTLKRALKKRV